MMTKKLLVIASLLLASTAGSMVASAQDVPDEHTDKNLPGVDDTTDGENAPNTPNGIVEKRHALTKTALEDDARIRDAGANKLAEYEAGIKNVDDEVKKIVEGIRADAEADKKRILEAAAAQAATMKRDADLRIAAEIEI